MTIKDFPKMQETTCPFCGRSQTATRQGTGKPWRGSLDYWYSVPKHECKQGELVSQQMDTIQKGLSK